MATPAGSAEPDQADLVAAPREDPPGSSDDKPSGKRDKDDHKGGPLAFLKELPALVVLAFLLALLIKTFLVQAFFIPSESMVPTLQVGDRVLVNKVVYHLHEPRRGDIIVFENPRPLPEPDRNPVAGFLHWFAQGLGFSQNPDEDYIKRVIGLPGDTIEAKKGHVYVNGERLDEPWLPEGAVTADFGPEKVPEGELFVMGDNRGNSNDSRYALGPIPMDKVVGRAFVKIWPPSRIGGL